MKKYIILVCIFIWTNLFGQTYNPAIQTWIIDAETAPCGSIDGGECLLFKIQGKKEFEVLNEKIEGFDYEKGNTYTISVKQEIKQPPIAADESVFKYVLVKIISKKSVRTISNTSVATTTSQQKIFEINFETVPCESDNSKTCLLVREKGKKEFEILNVNIYGFNYETGYTYQIVVKPTTDGNYYFVSEISKKFVQSSVKKYQPLTSSYQPSITTTNTGKIIGKTNIQTSSSLDNKWYLRKMKDGENSSFVTDDNVMWIEINTFSNSIKGFGACNNFEAVLRTDLSSTFFLDKLTPDYSNCGNKKLENLFFELLQQADGFEIKNGNLILSKRWNYLLEFVSNPNNKEEITTTYTPPTIIKNDDKTYATNQSINKQDTYIPPLTESIKTQTSSSIQTTTKQTDISSTDDKDKEIEELKRQLAEKKQLEEQKRLQAEQEALAAKKKQEEAAAEAARLAEIEKQKAAKQKEIDELKRQLAEKEKELNTEQPVNTKTTTNKPSSSTKTKVMTEEKPTTTKPSKTTNIADNIPTPEYENIVYYLKDKNLYVLDRTTAIFKGSTKDSYLELPSIQSANQYNKNSLPKLYIKLTEDEIPNDVVFLHICDFKKEKRIISLNANKNTVDISFKKVSANVYEIILPANLETNEFAFVTKSEYNQLGGVTFNTTTTKIACFGIEEKTAEPEAKESTNNSSKDCKPDDINIDKITKEKKESWYLKLASSFVLADKYNGKDQFIFYFQLIKIESKKYFGLVIQKTATVSSQMLGDELVFEKGNKVLFGLVDSKPYEMLITDVYKDKKIFESSRQVVTTHYLIHEISEEEVPYVKDLLTNKNIDAIRVVLNDGTFLNKDVKEKKSDKLIAKANCFFDAIK